MLPSVIWFKRDLRLEDHAPLWEASCSGPLLPLYIIEPDYWRLPDVSRRHWHFLHDCLVSLNNRFSQYGGYLCVRIGKATDILHQLKQEVGPFQLYAHQETGNDWTYKRDLAVHQWCRVNRVPWLEFQQNGVWRRLKTRDGWGEKRTAWMSQPFIPVPTIWSFVKQPHSDEWPQKNDPLFGASDIGSVQPGGQAEAIKTLHHFLHEGAAGYMQNISKPSTPNCSRLSTHITYGTLSIRQIEQATRQQLALYRTKPDPSTKPFIRNLAAFLSRLAWHCHFIQKLEQQPEIEFKCMHPAFETMRIDSFRQDFFEAWKAGQTGYPLVDACMRHLHAWGWLNFRMRAMLVSFASYHLWLDWRQTAPFLATLFTDYEPGIHYSQFQMQSGVTGINALRIYNPIKQSLEHDPSGTFIRQYVPELQDVPIAWIHEPWLMHKRIKGYPSPIVDHEQALQLARDRLSTFRKKIDFKVKAQAINKKLGSRKNTLHQQPKNLKVNHQQLDLQF